MSYPYQLKSLAEYREAYQRSIQDPAAFWASVAENFTWRKKWDNALEWNFKDPEVKWFQGGKLNITENCLDRHLEKLFVSLPKFSKTTVLKKETGYVYTWA
jgi:acetyl-CoA synthetase